MFVQVFDVGDTYAALHVARRRIAARDPVLPEVQDGDGFGAWIFDGFSLPLFFPILTARTPVLCDGRHGTRSSGFGVATRHGRQRSRHNATKATRE
jgi:hypothetical protein